VTIDKKLDPWNDVLGAGVSPARLAENIETFSDILEEIRKLRTLDLTDIHPPLLFDPTAVYRQVRRK
jgi:hypothetical protein